MELEYKFQLNSRADGERVIAALRGRGVIEGGPRRYNMNSRYYDADGILSAAGYTLRLRRENSTSVCCLKCNTREADGARLREEYECEAGDIAEGIRGLGKIGAPPEFMALVASLRLEVCGQVMFTREAYTAAYGGARLEICLDEGVGATGPFGELEMEYKSGDVGEFMEFAREAQGEYGLVVESRSKAQWARGSI